MGRAVAPYRVGLYLQIDKGTQAGFRGEVAMTDEGCILVVDRASRNAYWFNVDGMDKDYGKNTWFTWIDLATTPIEIIDDLIRDWDRDEMDAHWKYKDVVETLREARDRIRTLPTRFPDRKRTGE